MANKPVQEVRLGAIKAAIWANDTERGTRYNVTLSRLYKDGDQWKTSESFGRDDLPLVGKVADLAHTWIFQQSQNSNGNGHENGHNPEPADNAEGKSETAAGRPSAGNPKSESRKQR